MLDFPECPAGSAASMQQRRRSALLHPRASRAARCRPLGQLTRSCFQDKCNSSRTLGAWPRRAMHRPSKKPGWKALENRG